MKVAIIAPEGLMIPAKAGGSVQIYLEELYRSLQSAQGTDTNPSSTTEVQLLSPQGTRRLHHETHIGFASPNTKAYRQAISEHLHKAPVDIIQVENRPDFALQLQREFPQSAIILNLHSTTFLKERHISQADASTILSTSDAVVVNSHYLRRVLHTKFQIHRPTSVPIRVIYPGVNLTVFSQHEHRYPQKFTRHRPLNILFVGRIVPQKGIAVIVAAVQQLSNLRYPIHLTIVGKSHPWSRSYESKVKQDARGLPITFTGFVPPARLHHYYRQADVFVCPSQHNEAFGMVNLEALASGLPVIGSRVGGIQEIITEECGLLVRRFKNPDAWQRQLLTLIRQPKRYRRFSRNARVRAERFTWQHTASHFVSLYHQVYRT